MNPFKNVSKSSSYFQTHNHSQSFVYFNDPLKTSHFVSPQASAGHLVGIARQTSALQDELSALKLEEVLGSQLLKSLEDPRGSAKDKLLIQVELTYDSLQKHHF